MSEGIDAAAAKRWAVFRSVISKYSSTEMSIEPRRSKVHNSPSIIFRVASQSRRITSRLLWTSAIFIAVV